MAIVQISRITARKGLQDDLPAPLAGAELGWALDSRRLFIGNGSTLDGAPVEGNTEVLTEFSNLLEFATTYTYQGQAAGYVVQTGLTVGSPITLSLQSRLDVFANVKDFGATGDGATDDTAAINRALYQLYCVQANPEVRRSLFFPAGEYIITDTIAVPSYANLYGDGANSSILNFQVNAWSVGTTAYAAGVLVSYNNTYYRSSVPVPLGVTSIDALTPTNDLYWVAEALPQYIMRTADSKQQTGLNINTNGATPPVNIEVSGMGLNTNQEITGILVEDAAQCYFNQFNITGPYVISDFYPTLDSKVTTAEISAIAWASTPGLISNQIVFNQCTMSGFTHVTSTSANITGITLTNNAYSIFYQGIVLTTDPTGIALTQNTFDKIYAEGIVFDGTSLNATGYNIFYDVGNHMFGNASAATPVIRFTANNNISVGDMFQRTPAQSITYKCIDIGSTQNIAFTSGTQMQMGTYTRDTGVVAAIADNVSNTTLLTFNAILTRAIKIEYTFVRGTKTETGTIVVVASTDGTGGNLAIDNTVVLFNSDPGITFSATETGSVVTVKYSTTSTGSIGTIHYSTTHLA